MMMPKVSLGDAQVQPNISADTFKKLHEIVVSNCAVSSEPFDDHHYYKALRTGGFRKGLVEVRHPLEEEDEGEESGQGVVQFCPHWCIDEQVAEPLRLYLVSRFCPYVHPECY